MTTRHTAALALVLVSLTGIGVFAVHAPKTEAPVAATALPVVASEETATSSPVIRATAPLQDPEPAPTQRKTATNELPTDPASPTPETPDTNKEQPIRDYSFASPITGTVLDAMRAHASSSSFTFISHEYPGMGAFIDSIGGLESGDGYYWILYVNGADAARGASAQQVKVGDIVEWRYEKGY